ncbi:MAG: SpoIID/LytB domain-containing protein [Spirochaetes bacterium]|nr:SpoIID/LytB domain-containing protein [Spirochaetota bacterium]
MKKLTLKELYLINQEKRSLLMKQLRNLKIITKIFLLLIIILFISGCQKYIEKAARFTSQSMKIRVRLKLSEKIRIKIDPHLIVEDTITQEKWIFLTSDYLYIIQKSEGIFINEKKIESPVTIYSTKNRLIQVNERFYLGAIKVFPAVTGLYLVNYLPLETYLLSVLPSEVPVSFHPEALKAQAIIARTYSTYFIKKHQYTRHYDVDDTVSYQVFNGFDQVKKRKWIKKILAAVQETEGQVITYQSEPIIAYFHSNSGGYLISAGDYFGSSSDRPYFQAKEDPYSLGFPGATWKYQMPLKDFNSQLAIDHPVQFKLNEKQWVQSVLLDSKEITPKQIRRTIGYHLLKSERFAVKQKDNMLFFQGIGYGHGVGLSQWGAQGMALKGNKAQQIIDFYYPGTVISNLYD